MVSFGEKAKIKKAGNLNYGRSYVITTLQKAMPCLKDIKDWKLFCYNSFYFEKLRLCANIRIKIMIGLIEIHSQMENFFFHAPFSH